MRMESVPFAQAYSCRSSSAKGVVRSVMVESVGEGVDEGLQLVDSMRQIVGCIELVQKAYPASRADRPSSPKSPGCQSSRESQRRTDREPFFNEIRWKRTFASG